MATGFTTESCHVTSTTRSDSDSDSEDDKPKKGPVRGAAPAAASAPSKPKVPVNAAEVAANKEAALTAAAVAAKKKAAAQAEEPKASDGPAKISNMEIKKLNGDALKEALKARGLDVQGQKKDLMKRLSDYEAARP